MADMQKRLAMIVGIVLTITGVMGFIVGDSLAGLGLNTLHNVVHLLTGVLGLVFAFVSEGKMAKQYNKWLGTVYILIAVLGFAAKDLMVSLLNINMADNMLHLVLGIVLAGVGFGLKSEAPAAM